MLVEISNRSIFFNFQGVLYEQTCNVAMGSPLFSVVSNLYMYHFEIKDLNTYSLKPDF